MTETIGLIAGNGRFPLIFAETAKREGVRVVAVAHRGETDTAIGGFVDAVTWVRVGELGKMIRTFREAGVRRAVMAGGGGAGGGGGGGGGGAGAGAVRGPVMGGGVSRPGLSRAARPALRGAMSLARLRSFRDDSLLRAVAGE